METDIGQPFQYQPPSADEMKEGGEEDSTPLADMEGDYHHQQPQMWHYPTPPPPTSMTTTQDSTKLDLGSIDKNTLIIAFAVFLLGFFMGKTMQPVILRSH